MKLLCDLFKVFLRLKKCCYCVDLRLGVRVIGVLVLLEGLLVMCGLLELEDEEEKRRSNLSNGAAGTVLFLLGILIVGGASESKPDWLIAGCVLLPVPSIGLVVNAAITYVRKGANMTLYLMIVILLAQLYCEIVIISLVGVLRENIRREREISVGSLSASPRAFSSLRSQSNREQSSRSGGGSAVRQSGGSPVRQSKSLSARLQ